MSRRISVCLIVMVTLVLGVLSNAGEAQEKLVYSNYQYLEPGLGEFWREVEAAFEEEYGVEVEVVSVPARAYWDQLLTAMVGGEVADVYYMQAPRLLQYVRMGVLEPLDNWMDVEYYNENFYATQRELAVVDGKTYAIWHQNAHGLLVYNERLLKEAGLDGPPTTPEELYEYGMKLTDAPHQYGFSIVDQAIPQLLEEVAYYVLGWGAHFADESGPTATDPRLIEALEFYKRIFDSGMHAVGVEKPVLRQMMWEGRVAMRIDGPWYWGFAKSADSREYEHLKAAPLPFPEPYAQGGGSGLVIPKNAKNKELAAKFIAFVNRPEWQREFMEVATMMPGSPEADATSFVEREPWFQIYLDTADYARPRTPRIFQTMQGQFEKHVVDAVSSILHRDVPVAEAMEQLQYELEMLLED